MCHFFAAILHGRPGHEWFTSPVPVECTLHSWMAYRGTYLCRNLVWNCVSNDTDKHAEKHLSKTTLSLLRLFVSLTWNPFAKERQFATKWRNVSPSLCHSWPGEYFFIHRRRKMEKKNKFCPPTGALFAKEIIIWRVWEEPFGRMWKRRMSQCHWHLSKLKSQFERIPGLN